MSFKSLSPKAALAGARRGRRGLRLRRARHGPARRGRGRLPQRQRPGRARHRRRLPPAHRQYPRRDLWERPAAVSGPGADARKINVPVTRAGPMRICVALPGAGRYAVAVRHDVNGNNRSRDWSDGAGFSRNPRISLTNLRPQLQQCRDQRRPRRHPGRASSSTIASASPSGRSGQLGTAMASVALLSNPKSTGNRSLLPRVRAFCAEHKDIFHYEVEDVSQIGQALRTIARVKPKVIVINGGDGTVQAALTELHQGGHFGRRARRRSRCCPTARPTSSPTISAPTATRSRRWSGCWSWSAATWCRTSSRAS